MPSFALQLRELVDARASGVWIVSDDHEEALLAIQKLAREEEWDLLTWDEEAKVRNYYRKPRVSGDRVIEFEPTQDDFPALIPKLHQGILPKEDKSDSSRLLVLRNFHHRMLSPDVTARVLNALAVGKRAGSFIVVLTSKRIGDPLLNIGTDLQSQFVVLEHSLPTKEELAEVARSVEMEDAPTSDEEMPAIVDAAIGMTFAQAELAYSLSMVNPDNNRKIVPAAIWNFKSQMLAKSEALTLEKGTERFSDLGGMQGLKDFCLKSLQEKETHPLARPLGVMCVGPAGTGKTSFCKALGNELGRPTIRLDCGALRGRFQGQTEEQTRRALKVIDAMGKVVLFIDEIEKALSGSDSSGSVDGGTGSRLMGTLLTWMNDRKSDAYIVASCNSVGDLPAAFTRAERFDALFFLDLPDPAEKKLIWPLYIKMFGLADVPMNTLLRLSENWTGAEIRACCRLAAMMHTSLEEASINVIPTAITGKEALDALHEWANQRVMSARTGRRYVKPGTAGGDGAELSTSSTKRRRPNVN